MIKPVGRESNYGRIYTDAVSKEARRLSEGRDSEIKNKSSLSAEDIQSIKEQAEISARNLRELVERLILRQSSHKSKGVKAGKAEGRVFSRARAEVSEDGYYGVKAVSDRIVAFAKAVSGNDVSKLNKLKSAITKGFEEAAKAWGGELPGICRETYDEVMRKLEDWKKESVNIIA